MHLLKSMFMAILAVFVAFPFAIASEGNAVTTITQTVGEDQIPVTITTFSEFGTLQEWVDKSYSTDKSSPVHYLPETLISTSINGVTGLAFKTFEYQGYVQHLVFRLDDNLILISTPHGEFNPDGSVVFQEILGFTLPNTGFSNLSEVDRDFQENAEAQHDDFDQLNRDVAQQSYSSSSFGSKVGSFNGVTAYSNGSTSYVSKQYNTYNGYQTGMKWQCVEYVNRYFWAKFGRKIAGGNANTYYSNASSKGLKRAANGSSDKPQPGNILCSAGGPHGHVAIITKVGKDYVEVIHQNWSNSSSDNRKRLSMKVKNGKYTISGFSSSYPIQGWLWPK